MRPEILIPISLFGVIFGIVYLFITARNRERLALIDKGADASIFYGNDKRLTPMWQVIVVNLALLLMGIGIGIFVASLLHYSFGVDEEIAYPGTIFLMAGIGLLTGLFVTKKLNKQV